MKTELRTIFKSVLYIPYINLKYKILFPFRHNIRILNSEDTVNYIIENKCSVSRYGDGEIDMIIQLLSGNTRCIGTTFQTYDKRLAERLFDIIHTTHYDNKKHIVCIPYWFREKIELYKPDVQYYCKKYFCKNYSYINYILNKERAYFNANMSRFYLSYLDKSNCKKYVELLKKIWNGRRICFVEGEYSRLGVGNDLFSNAAEIKRILCPPCNAFEYYDEILNSVLQNVSDDVLILIALGHTATVLAYDLSEKGYQAIDLGHIDVEYEWMLMGATCKIPLKGKYVNEVGDGHDVSECNDIIYHSQILARVS